MNKNFKLTILMPCYNREPYIREALDSVFAQVTNFNYKLIIIDDASTDNSLQIAKEYQQKYPDNIELIENEKNLKLSKTIYKGYALLKTDYFCVLDPDDYYTDNNVLQNAVDFLEAHPDYTIYSANYEVLENNKISPSWLKGNFQTCTSDFNDYLNNKAYISCCLVTVFRNVIFKNGIIPHKLKNMLENNSYMEPFDSDSFRNAAHIKEGKAFFVSKPAGVYRQHQAGKYSSLSRAEKQQKGAELYYNMYLYFDKTYYSLIIISLTFLKEGFKFINQMPHEKRGEVLQKLNHLQNEIQKLKLNNKIRMIHIRNRFLKLCSCFIFNKSARKNFRRKYVKYVLP